MWPSIVSSNNFFVYKSLNSFGSAVPAIPELSADKESTDLHFLTATGHRSALSESGPQSVFSASLWVVNLRDGWTHQNGCFFWKVPNCLWPPAPPSFSENYIADFCHYKRFFGHEFRKKNAIWFSENGGGVKGRLEFFQKFIRFGRAIRP